MTARQHTQLVREGQYVAEMSVEPLEGDMSWAPYLSLEDAYKLDDVRDALRRGDVATAARLAGVYQLTPVP